MSSADKPRMQEGAATAPHSDVLAAIPESATSHPPRRSSLGILLRRSKSTELKGTKKGRDQELLRQQREAATIPKSPPRLPDLYNGAAPPKFQSFGGEGGINSIDSISGRSSQGHGAMEPSRSLASMASGSRNNDWVDPYARTESMTHRGRYSYASSAISTINSPRRVRRRKDPTPFNILIIGARSAGKTSFLHFLKNSLALPTKNNTHSDHDIDDISAPQNIQAGNFEPHYLETEIDGERIGLTLWDSEGLEKNVVDLQLRELSSFVESKFQETFTEEMKVVRAPGVQDTHIHCAFLVLDPGRLDQNFAAARIAASNGTNAKRDAAARFIGGLDEDLDLQILRTLQGKTTVVPVIAKADTITTAHMAYLKKTVSDSLRQANLDPFDGLGLDDPDSDTRSDRSDEGDEDAEDKNNAETLDGEHDGPSTEGSQVKHKRQPSSASARQERSGDEKESSDAPYLPLSIISPDLYERGVIGRKFPWGFADPMNPEHCDFVRLKEAVFSEWRGELREASREFWYEAWRSTRLKHRDGGKSGR